MTTPQTFNFAISGFDMVQRFLMIGSFDSVYRIKGSGATMSFDAVDRALNTDAAQVIHLIKEISTGGRAPKNDPAIALLAYVASKPAHAAEAFNILSNVCRIGTHLFQFVDNYKAAGGKWNAVAKRAVTSWYTNRPADRLAVQLLKYQQRGGWSHGDVLRLAHVKPQTPAQDAMFHYAAKATVKENVPLPGLYEDVFKMNKGDLTSTQVIGLLEQNPLLSWEMVPSKYRSDREVLRSLVTNMGQSALIRQLGLLTSHGVLDSTETRKLVTSKLTNAELLKAGRVHPITLLNALKQYSKGRGDKGSLTWSPESGVKAALDDAFYLAFDQVEDTGEHYLVGVDVSGSMQSYAVNGMENLMASEVAVVMGMAAVRAQKNAQLLGFGRNVVDLKITPDMSLHAAMRRYTETRWDGSATNASVMFDFARRENKIEKFVFVTDNDINQGVGPMNALREYRRGSGKNAKMAVIATALSNLSIADPMDRGCLDIAGFDSAAPGLIAAL